MLFNIYVSLLILFFFIVNVIKGLLTPAWKMREAEQARSTAGSVFWLTLTIALLLALKHLYFGGRSESASRWGFRGRRTGFRGDRENDSGVKTNTVPG